MDYSKKDFCFHSSSNDHHNKATAEGGVVSVRVQLWDCQGLFSTHNANSNLEEWKRTVMQHSIQTMLLIVSLTDYYPDICDTIREWKTWLDRVLQQQGTNTSQVILLLTQADRVVSQEQLLSPAEWMHLGATIQQTCQDCQIASWHITTASSSSEAMVAGVASVDEVFLWAIESSLQKAAANDDSSSPSKRKRMMMTPSTEKSTVVVPADAVVAITPS